MKAIKNYIMHMFKGNKEREFIKGRNFAVNYIYEKMKEYNGITADEWCDRVWTMISRLKAEAEE